jgi:hypothetical protein
LDKSFTYQLGINPAYPDQEATRSKGDFDKIEKTIISMQIEQDMIFHFQRMQTKHNLYYFVSFQPYFGQNPRSTETWNNTTVSRSCT